MQHLAVSHPENLQNEYIFSTSKILQQTFLKTWHPCWTHVSKFVFSWEVYIVILLPKLYTTDL
jgi:hypothetical protein